MREHSAGMSPRSSRAQKHVCTVLTPERKHVVVPAFRDTASGSVGQRFPAASTYAAPEAIADGSALTSACSLGSHRARPMLARFKTLERVRVEGRRKVQGGRTRCPGAGYPSFTGASKRHAACDEVLPEATFWLNHAG